MNVLHALNESIHSGAIAGEANRRARHFLQVARIRALHPESLAEARAYAEAHHLVPEIKAAIAPGSTTSLDAIAPIEPLAAGFLETMRHASAFDRLLPNMRNVPFRTRIVVTTAGANGSIVAEGAPKPISNLTLASHEIDQCKAVAICVLTKELLQAAGPAIMDLFGRELRGAIAVTTDREFVARLTAGVTPIASAGATLANIRSDVAAAYAAITTSAQSKLFWLMDPGTAKSLAAKGSDTASTFPEMTPGGGMFSGVPVVVTDGISAADNIAVLIDANGIAAASGQIEIASTGQAALELNSTPATPVTAAAVVTSLWQQNLVALRVERYFGAERLGNSVQVISGVNY